MNIAKVGKGPKCPIKIARPYNAIGNYEKALAQYWKTYPRKRISRIGNILKLGWLYLKLKKQLLPGGSFLNSRWKGICWTLILLLYEGVLKELNLFPESICWELQAFGTRFVDQHPFAQFVSIREILCIAKGTDQFWICWIIGIACWTKWCDLINLKALANYNDYLLWLAYL